VAFFIWECEMKKLLVVDNYDSFTYNLVQMFMHYPLYISVHRSDKISVDEVEIKNPDYILISPGPKDPAHAGISVELIQRLFKKIPIFGVCLGMQCINEAFGGRTVRAPLPIHGKTSMVHHTNKGIFNGVPSPFKAARYHSLMTCLKNTHLQVTSTSDDGVIMGMSHPEFPVHGVQFHPESFMTEHGFALVENFLNLG
jgi:anthranilate synthase component II